MKVRERLHPDTRRAQLLQLGAQAFADRSYEDFSMDDLATRAGVSKGLLYHYFPTKREFYMAALRGAVQEMLELTEPRADETAEQALRLGLDAYLGYVESHAPAYRAVLRGGIGADPEVSAIADGFRDRIAERLFAGTGLTHPTPAERLAVKGWIGFVEAASLDWVDRRDLEREDLIRLLLATFAASREAAREPPPAPAGGRRRAPSPRRS